MNLIFLGAPGAGKGTQAEKISAIFNIPAISTGVIIREAVKNGTEMGLAAKSYIEAGNLVPDQVVIGIIKERLAQGDCKKGFILDGFPRTVPQAQALEDMGVNIDLVIDIEVPDEAIVARMGGRRTCEKCGATYHVDYKPSKDGVTCDACGSQLTIRKDDLPEVVQSRLSVYHEKTEPLISFYRERGKLRTVIGQEKVEDTSALTLAAVRDGSSDRQ